MSIAELSWIGLIVSIVGFVIVVIVSIWRYFDVLKKYENGYYKEYTQPYLSNNNSDSIQEAVKYLKITNN